MMGRAGAVGVIGAEVLCPLKPDPPPSIDGQLNEWYAHPAPIEVTGAHIVWGKPKWQNEPDLSGTMWLYWDENYLYVAADVVDDHFIQDKTGSAMYYGDHLELYLDTQYAPGVKGPFGQGQFVLGLSPGNLLNSGDPLMDLPPEVDFAVPAGHRNEGCKIAASRTEKGYALEAAIPWKVLGIKASKGLLLGMDFCMSDTDNPGLQDTISSLVPGPWAGQTREHLVPLKLGDSQGK